MCAGVNTRQRCNLYGVACYAGTLTSAAAGHLHVQVCSSHLRNVQACSERDKHLLVVQLLGTTHIRAVSLAGRPVLACWKEQLSDARSHEGVLVMGPCNKQGKVARY